MGALTRLRQQDSTGQAICIGPESFWSVAGCPKGGQDELAQG